MVVKIGRVIRVEVIKIKMAIREMRVGVLVGTSIIVIVVTDMLVKDSSVNWNINYVSLWHLSVLSFCEIFIQSVHNNVVDSVRNLSHSGLLDNFVVSDWFFTESLHWEFIVSSNFISLVVLVNWIV